MATSSKFFITDKVFLLINKGNPLYCQHKNAKYMYAAQSKYLANHMCSFVESSPHVEKNICDVTCQLNENLEKYDLRMKFKNVGLDSNGVVKLKKHAENTYNLQTMRYKDFLLESFEYDVGTVLITEILRETDNNVNYRAQFIEPFIQDENIIESLGFLLPLWGQFPPT